MYCDDSIMPFGSDAYGHIYQLGAQVVVPGAALLFDTNHILHNIEHKSATDLGFPVGDASIYVRKSGVYSIMFGIFTNESAQFTIFKNGVELPLSTFGKNSGAGELYIRSTIYLEKDDVIELRNYVSTAQQASLISISVGSVPIVSAFCTIIKIASEQNEYKMKPKLEYEKIKHKYCFEYILNKLLQDGCFDLIMSDAHGEFYSVLAQTVAVESSIMLENSNSVSYLDFTPNTSDIIVKKAGIYVIEYIMSTVQPSQFTLFVNNVPDTSSTGTLNKGSAQMMMRTILQLNVGDVVNLRNHTTNIGSVDLSVNSGGTDASTNVKIIMYKIAPIQPICEPPCDECDDRCDKYEKLYHLFIHFLDCEPRISIHGYSAYGVVANQCDQLVKLDDVVFFPLNGIVKPLHVHHHQGSSDVHIRKDGLYKITYSDSCDQPIQIAITVNGNIINDGGIGGSDNGAGQISVRKLVELHDGDIIKILNHASASGTINLTQNAGGRNVGINCELTCLRIDGLPVVMLPLAVKQNAK
jgi:hypothetical protein